VAPRNHRLLCGDARSADDYAKVLDSEGAIRLTDPPYNVPIDGMCVAWAYPPSRLAMGAEKCRKSFTGFLTTFPQPGGMQL